MSENYWPYKQDGRSCNLGSCPAFLLTEQDMEFIVKASVQIRLGRDIEEVAAEMGIPVGTCRVKMLDMVVNSKCDVSDTKFKEWFHDFLDKKEWRKKKD